MSRTVKRQMLFWGAMFLLLVGIVLHVQQMEFMAAALLLLPPLSFAFSRGMLNGVEVQRRLTCRLRAGERCPVTLVVSNPTPRPRPAFWIEDTLPEGLARVEEDPQLVLDLGPGENQAVRYTLRALRRGLFELGPIILGACDPLGLRDLERHVPQTTSLLVYPRVIALPDLWPRGPVERMSARRTRRLPGGIDLRGTREYVPGDDLRQIHWKVSAHRDKLTLVEREEPQGLYATAVLDLGPGVHAGRGNDTSLEYGVTLAASLLLLALDQGGSAGLVAVGDRDYSLAADLTPAHRWRLLESLAYCKTGGTQSLAEVVRERLPHLPRGSAVAVITPRGAEEVAGTAALLASRGLRAIWFLLEAPSFEPARLEGAPGESRQARLAASLTQRGRAAYVIRGDQPLEDTLRRRVRLAV